MVEGCLRRVVQLALDEPLFVQSSSARHGMPASSGPSYGDSGRRAFRHLRRSLSTATGRIAAPEDLTPPSHIQESLGVAPQAAPSSSLSRPSEASVTKDVEAVALTRAAR
jgi:hypothetical protein